MLDHNHANDHNGTFFFVYNVFYSKQSFFINGTNPYSYIIKNCYNYIFLHIPLRRRYLKTRYRIKKIKLHFYRAKIPLKICSSKRIPWLRSGFWIAEEERKKWQTPLTLSHSPFKTIEKNMKSFVFGVINNRIHVFFFAK